MSPSNLDPAISEMDRQTASQQAGMDTFGFDLGELALRELDGLVLMRAQRHDRFTATSFSKDLPAATGDVRGVEPAVLCLAPGEWLGIASADSAEALRQLLEAGIEGYGTLRDVSDGHAILRLSGAAAPWLLAKLSGLDYLGGTRMGNHCARTRMIDIAALVFFHASADEGDVFDLIIDRSYLAYLWAQLQTAAPHAIELSTTLGNPA